jgi:bifunctional non-homologous end joining protein LigD
MLLPDPMLARPGSLPLGSGYGYEVKWDGFRAIVSTEAGLQVRSRGGWDMTALLPELAELPSGLVLDGELVAPDEENRPSFPRLSPRILHGRPGIHVTFIVFDVLRVEGMSTMDNSYRGRRSLLEELDLQGAHWCTPAVFDDGAALVASVEEQGLEGIIAKPLESPYRPRERGWIKVKNRAYWRFGQELELAQSRRRSRTIFV